MGKDAIKRVLIVGGGTMGQQVAAHCAMHGLSVRVFDVDPHALEKAAAIKETAGAVFKSKYADRIKHFVAGLRIETNADRAAADVQLLVEAVPEKPKLKRQVLSQFNRLCPADAIFATNTSTLLPSALAEASGRPAQFAALHFSMERELAEIMPHPGTSPDTVRRLEAFAQQIDHLPIICRKEVPGCVLNTLLMSFNAAALQLAADGVATFEDIDRAWMKTMDVPTGPFGILDGVGLDTAWNITEFRAKVNKDPESQKIADYLKRYVEQGRLGIKSGVGFYSYPNPTFSHEDFLSGS